MSRDYVSVAALLLLSFCEAFSQSGTITGYVADSKTGEPLAGVNVIVNELKGVGASTDLKGRFKILAPVGSYSIKASLMGYQPVVKTDVIATAGGENHIVVRLSESPVELGQVMVTPDYFEKAAVENNLGTVVLGSEEVKRSPGSAQDFQRILQAMAGVSFTTDQRAATDT